MPRQFTPSDRETVAEQAEEIPHVHDVQPCGPALLVVYRNDYEGAISFNGLAEDHGWKLYLYRPDPNRDLAILAPITEVPG